VDYVLDSGPLIYLLFWNQQQMHHPQSMQQTPPLDSCHCYLTSCVTASGAFLWGVRSTWHTGLCGVKNEAVSSRYAEDEGGGDP
jgi:hypothetical protein